MRFGARLWVVGLVCGLSVSIGFAQSAKSATDERRLMAALRQLKKDGLCAPYPDGVFPERESRYEIAVVLHYASQVLECRLKELEAIGAASPDSVPQLDRWRTPEDVIADAARLGAWGKDARLLEELAHDFKVEIGSLGVDLADMVRGLQRAEARCRNLAQLGPGIAARFTPFPHSAPNRWAFAAFAEMKEHGIPVSFRRGMEGAPTRAQAVAWTLEGYDHVIKVVNDLEAQITAINAKLDAEPSKAGLQAVRDQLEALQAGVNGMKAWTDDISNLRKLAVSFTPEIRAFGRDVEAVKKNLGDLVGRTGGPDGSPPWLDVHGTMDFVGVSGVGHGTTVDGRPMSGSAWLHEGSVRLATTRAEGVRAKATVAFGDTLSRPAARGPFGNQSETLGGERFGQGSETAYLREFSFGGDTSFAGNTASWTAGRQSIAFGPHFLARPDTTPLYDNDLWDDGRWIFDGGLLEAQIGRANVVAFGGFASQFLTGWIGEGLQPLRVGRSGGPWEPALPSSRPLGLASPGQVGMPVDEMYGVRLQGNFGEQWQGQIVGLWFDADRARSVEPGVLCNRLSVGGGTLRGVLQSWTLGAGVGASTLTYNEHRVVDRNNTAYWFDGAYSWEFGKVKAGYKEIEANYAAPGDWGRIGLWWNPTDLKGSTLGGDVDLSECLRLSVGGEWYTGIDDGQNDWGTRQKVDRYTAELKWHPSPCWDVAIGGEHVRYRGLGGPEPTEQWLTLSAQYGITNNSRIIATWQTGRVSADGAPAFRIDGRNLSSGGLFVLQTSYRF